MFEVNVAGREAFSAVGLKVRTDMQKAMRDCSGLWHDAFAPRMGELVSGPVESYGVSRVVEPDKGVFDYFALLPFPEDRAVPPGMERVRVPAGLYAECPVNTLEDLSRAYSFIFSEWLPRHPEYAVNMSAPSYEVYPADFMQHGRLTVYFPVQKA